MIEECVRKANDIEVEWILANDYPQEPIEIAFKKDTFDIVILQTDQNKGIHSSSIT